MSYMENPKTTGSGIVCCAPQTTKCPRGCADCFAQHDGVYATLPNIPPVELTKGRVVRIGDISDAYHQLDCSLAVASKYDDCFLNSSYSKIFDEVSDIPVVLTINPGEMTDVDFYKLDPIPENLMFVRYRANAWNTAMMRAAINYYTSKGIVVILTWMAYTATPIPELYADVYEFRQRTLNSYWCIKEYARRRIERDYGDNDLVYSCGKQCVRCGNCLRGYFETKERMRNADKCITKRKKGFEKMQSNDKAIQMWWFFDAPKEYRDLSGHGGDEDYLAFVPDGVDTPWWMDDVYQGGWAVCDVECHIVSGGTVYITAHA